MLINHPDSAHPQHPHHLECPHCGRHAVVTKAESHYVCLNCSWERDLTNEWPHGLAEVLSFVVTGLLLLLLL
ncbi:MAG: hypothetical protein KME14_05540 [Tildeniella torsiva UHER 1998/13D]|jgi:DNA-directed RNA polymerase subunit RPC12/RpoP|nr:hypothetical protein [Tildeniella torsiva UHER 1998/13D]